MFYQNKNCYLEIVVKFKRFITSLPPSPPLLPSLSTSSAEATVSGPPPPLAVGAAVDEEKGWESRFAKGFALPFINLNR